MRKRFRRYLSLLLISALLLQCLTGCSGGGNNGNGQVYIEENFVKESFVDEDFLDEKYLEESYIYENLLYEEGVYEYKIEEEIISQAVVIEVVVGENTEDEILAMLPEELDDYNIEWAKVIGKFAAGTAIIITVGVINNYIRSKGIEPTYFMMCTTKNVVKEALVGGAIAATLNVAINDVQDGELPEEAIKKYTIEGYADGYMWGAISAVLKVSGTNIKRLNSLKLAMGKKATINSAGQVFDEAGKLLGKAYYDKNGIWHLVSASSKQVMFFDKKGKQIVDVAVLASKGLSDGKLPSNGILRLAADSTENVILCYTDDLGQIYKEGKNLIPNITYKLRGYTYSTDEKGRIVKVVFEKLRLKPEGRGRLIIRDSLDDIGHGFAENATDDRGHLIADMFDGDNTLANIVPMDKNINRGSVAAMESNWAKCITEGGNVSGSIDITYSGSSFRPDKFKYVYDMGQGKVETVITNNL